MTAETTELPAQQEAANGQQPETRRAELPAPFEGKWVRYRRRMTGREYIALMRGSANPTEAIEAVGSRVIEHNLRADGTVSTDSVLDYDLAVAIAILGAWDKAEDADALDPPSGESSPTHSG